MSNDKTSPISFSELVEKSGLDEDTLLERLAGILSKRAEPATECGVTPLKLFSPSGDVMGAVLVPREAHAALLSGSSWHFSYAPPPTAFPVMPNNAVDVGHVVLEPWHSARIGSGGVWMPFGDLWTFEKIDGCVFFPGFAFARKGCR